MMIDSTPVPYPSHQHIGIDAGSVLRLPLLLLTLVLTSALSAQPTGPSTNPSTPFELQRFDWEGEPGPGKQLLLENRWGDVRLRQNGGKTVLMHAVMQKIGDHPKVAMLQVEESDAQITLRIAYPPDQQPDTVRQGRVDVALLLPTGLPVSIIAERGEVSGKTLDNPIKIMASDQPVAFSSRSSVDIETRHGEVAILFKPHAHKSADDTIKDSTWGRIQTIDGDILISYYPDVEMGFDIVSGSSKTTDDPRLLQSRRYQARHVLMHTAADAPVLQLHSDTGQIVISNNRDRLGNQ